MIPFFQGKVDNFCALYAVINAAAVVSPLTNSRARDMLNETLVETASDPSYFADILYHRTDYGRLVRFMLDRYAAAHNFGWHAFDDETARGRRSRSAVEAPGRVPSVSELIDFFRFNSCGKKGKSVVFRFCRYRTGADTMFIDHWSTAVDVQRDRIVLFDCSLEQGGLYELPVSEIIPAPGGRLPALGALTAGQMPDWVPPRAVTQRERIVIPADCVFAVYPRSAVSNLFRAASPLETTAAGHLRSVQELIKG